MGLLHFFGGIFLVVIGITALVQHGVIKPSVFLGLLLIGTAVRDWRTVLAFANAGQQTLWRGRGLLALVPGLLSLASCAGLMELSPLAAMIFGGLIWVVAGILCWRWGEEWNRGQHQHEMLRISLQNWGRFYCVIGVIVSLLVVVGLVNNGWR